MPDAPAVAVGVRDDHDLVPAAHEALRQGPDVHLHATQPGIEKVAHHGDAHGGGGGWAGSGSGRDGETGAPTKSYIAAHHGIATCS